jgi:hypothetical protein
MRAAGHRKLVVAGGAIGVLVAMAVVVLASRWRGATREAIVPAPLLPEATGPLAEVVLHYVSRVDATIADTYADFLSATTPDVRVVFVIAAEQSSKERAALDARLGAIDPSGALGRRTTVVTSPGPITTWSKDRALVTTRPETGEPPWVISPAEPKTPWAERHNDWRTVQSLAAQSLGRYQARVAPFDFDAGDFAVSDREVIVDTNLLGKNRHRGIPDSAELGRRLRSWLGMPVVVLGTEPGDTPRHHLSMYLTPLTGRKVLVGDPQWARKLTGDPFEPGPVSVETGEPLRADYSDAMIARFERAARELAERGFAVTRIPNVPFDDKTYIAYTNGVYETRDGKRIAYMPVYGVAALDDAARKVYEQVGFEVRPVRVGKVYPHHGTIGCLVNVLARGGAGG